MTTIDQDAETLREYIRTAAGFDGSKGEAALDRILADHKDLDQAHAAEREMRLRGEARIAELEEEVERLRERNEWFVARLNEDLGERQKVLVAEVERLRKLLEWKDTLLKQENEEVFRLRRIEEAARAFDEVADTPNLKTFKTRLAALRDALREEA